MLCTTVKKDNDCNFMTSQGCTYNDGSCHTIVEKCNGCDHVVSFQENQYCMAYADPSSKWVLGRCNFATNVIKDGLKESKRVNPLKESKRKSRGK